MLEHAGFVDALRSHCGEFTAQQSIDVEVDADDDLAIADIETTRPLRPRPAAPVPRRSC
jgi:hypothetical protein